MLVPIDQRPIPIGPNDKIHPMSLAPIHGFVKIGFPIQDLNPLTVGWRPADPFQGLDPALRFARTAHSLTPGLPPSPGWPLSAPTLLVQQSHYRPDRPLLGIPAANLHRQG